MEAPPPPLHSRKRTLGGGKRLEKKLKRKRRTGIENIPSRTKARSCQGNATNPRKGKRKLLKWQPEKIIKQLGNRVAQKRYAT